jgi:hypothetical protein
MSDVETVAVGNRVRLREGYVDSERRGLQKHAMTDVMVGPTRVVPDPQYPPRTRDPFAPGLQKMPVRKEAGLARVRELDLPARASHELHLQLSLEVAQSPSRELAARCRAARPHA